jgi:hypothetical protein
MIGASCAVRKPNSPKPSSVCRVGGNHSAVVRRGVRARACVCGCVRVCMRVWV